MNVTNKQIIAFVREVENELLNSTKIKFSLNPKWLSNIPFEAGIYAAFDKKNLVYIGETANLNSRMNEVKRTYNHSFRKQLGKKLFNIKKSPKGKFPEKIENALNSYFEKNISFTFKRLNFGRLETESLLVQRNRSGALLNSENKRSKLHEELFKLLMK